jgi:pimeloyl-ACP methyl ester carboxylesterase
MLAISLAFAVRPSTAAPAPEGSSLERPSVVETTFKSVDATVAAQWDFPRNSPAPLVVLVPAGGRLDRNGWNPGLSEDPADGMYARLAAALVEAGFAVFRFDKPGAGKSSRGHYATERANALEAYTRAVDHARIDPEHVFLLGHAAGTDAIAGIYPRYASVVKPAGAVLLDSAVGERDSLRIEAPVLIVNSGRDPDDRLQYGKFVAEARGRNEDGALDTELVILDRAERGLLTAVQTGSRTVYTLDPDAVQATVAWLRRRMTATKRAASGPR